MRPEADAPPPMKVLRAHLAYLNGCRLIGGGTFTLIVMIQKKTARITAVIKGSI